MKARSSFAWSNRADIAPPLAPDRGHHCLYPKDVERPSQIVDERREAELGAHVIEASHQEGQNRWVNPARIARRMPNCGAPTPTPVPLRIS